MKRLFVLAILAIGMAIPATTHAGSPGTTADAYQSIAIYYGQLVRESAYVAPRVTYWCRRANLRGQIVTGKFLCRTSLYAGTPRRLRVVSDFEITCDGSRFCWVQKRLLTWRYP